KLQTAIETKLRIIFVVVRQCGTEMNCSNPSALAVFSPDSRTLSRIGKTLWLIHDQKRSAAEADITRVVEERNNASDEVDVVIRQMFLRDENLAIGTIPTPRPVLIRPAQAKRHIAFRILQHVVQRLMQDALSGEPIVVIAKRVDAVLLRQCNLLMTHFAQTQIIKT